MRTLVVALVLASALASAGCGKVAIALDGDGQVPADACDHLGETSRAADPPGASSSAAPPLPPSAEDEALRPAIDAVPLPPLAWLVDERTAVIAGDPPDAAPGITRTYCLPPGMTQRAVAAVYAGWAPYPASSRTTGWTRELSPTATASAILAPQERLLTVSVLQAAGR